MMRTYRDSEVVDFLIVGSGAAGGVIARELSRAGFAVVVMEQGPRLGLQDFEHDELKYWLANGITNDPSVSPQTYRKTAADVAKKSEPGQINPLWYARTVGGSSVHGGIAGTTFEDWPITYEELEPYYTKVDWEIGVSGLAGAHPNEPHRSKPYPMPPMPVKSSGVLLERGARK